VDVSSKSVVLQKPEEPIPDKPGPEPKPSGAKKQASGPTAAEILVDRFRGKGDLPNLIISLRRAINDKPYEPQLRSELVQAYMEKGWKESARDEAARAVQLAPNSASLHRLYGEGLLETNDAEGAVRELNEAVRLEGADAANHVSLGEAYWR